MNSHGDGAADPAAGSTGHTAVVDLSGVIKADSDNSANSINKSLRRAFKHAGTKGVCCAAHINSPGGSPVQSGLIVEEIKRLREKYSDIPMYAVVEEACASGGYYVAVMDGFGFLGTMNKLGVERRLFTAGTEKGFLDPFSPLSDIQRDHLQTLLDGIHEEFITLTRCESDG